MTLPRQGDRPETLTQLLRDDLRRLHAAEKRLTAAEEPDEIDRAASAWAHANDAIRHRLHSFREVNFADHHARHAEERGAE